MKLIWLRIQGFRRFNNQTTLNLVGKLVALVGQNEAGKTSLLHALEHIGTNREFAPLDLTRNHSLDSDEPVLEAAFALDEEDRAELGELEGGRATRWLQVKKYRDGHREFNVTPTLSRDHSLRSQCIRALKKAMKSPAIDAVEDLKRSQIGALASELEATSRSISSEVLGDLEKFERALRKGSTQLPKYLARLPDRIARLRKQESKLHPTEEAVEILKQRIPELLMFDESARDLRSEYNLSTQYDDPPRALANLVDVAGLNLPALYRATEGNDQAAIRQQLARSNDKLADVFTEEWNQSSVKVHFHLNGHVLHIQVEDEGRRFSTLGERSDGLRQFVSLMAFATVTHSARPILLVDEAEAHLHYDAQADLVQMFTTQDVARKVVYTTHSAGCLPEDLGVGVRLVAPIEEGPHSEVRNWFWTDDSEGFAPLLFGMGARTLAFFPTRKAVVVEGPSDLIMLPTLMRHAIGSDEIGFQTVPGLAGVSKGELSLLELAGRSVCYLTDDDDGGRALREQLVTFGISADRIFRISRPGLAARTIEDFVDPQIYRRAVNRQLHKWCDDDSIELDDMPASGRAEFLADWTESHGVELSKRAIAYEVLECLRDEPDANLVDARRQSVLRRVHRELLGALGEGPRSD